MMEKDTDQAVDVPIARKVPQLCKDKRTVTELKEALRARGRMRFSCSPDEYLSVKVSGNKTDLVRRLDAILAQEHGCESSSLVRLCGASDIAQNCSSVVNDSLWNLSRQYFDPDEDRRLLDGDFFAADYEVSDHVATVWEEIQDDPAYAAYCEFLTTHTAAAVQEDMPNTVMSTPEQHSTCTFDSADLSHSLPQHESHGINLGGDFDCAHRAQSRSCASSSIDLDIPRTPCPHEVQLRSSYDTVAYSADQSFEQSSLMADSLE